MSIAARRPAANTGTMTGLSRGIRLPPIVPLVGLAVSRYRRLGLGGLRRPPPQLGPVFVSLADHGEAVRRKLDEVQPAQAPRA